MARHNYLVQRSCNPTSDGNAVWLDTFTSNHPINRGPGVAPMKGRSQGVPDAFGNDGFPTLEAARAELEHFRANYGNEASYRIIQIVS